MNNRLYNCKNPYQGETKKVLCVCSAGLLRSPTAAHVLSAPPYNYNTRCAGLDRGHALILVDDVLIAWADEIVVMNKEQERTLGQCFDTEGKKIICLDIADNYAYRDPVLVGLIKNNYDEHKEQLE